MLSEISSSIRHPVLMLDDDINVLHAMKRLFHGHPKVDLMTTDSPLVARQILDSKDIHVLVTDQRMPESSGVEMLAYAKKVCPETICILLTGHADTEVLAESINTGNIRRYYQKPVDPAAFIQDMEEFIRDYENRSAEQEKVQKLQSNIQDSMDQNIQLSMELDEDVLFRIILDTSRKIAGADAGTIYLTEKSEDNEPCLRVRKTYMHSCMLPFTESVLPIDERTPAGYAAFNVRSLDIKDAYNISPNLPYTFDRKSDSLLNYRTKSIVAIPIKDIEGNPLGVIQLVNRKKNFPDTKLHDEEVLLTLKDFEENTEAFSPVHIAFVEAIADHAGITIENVRMVRRMKTQFDEFVIASVQAIEARDPATGGHSLRVAALCAKVARAMKLTETQVQALEYAAILHDFGKIYIDKEILVKKNKLRDQDLERIGLTLDYVYRYQELHYAQLEARLAANSDSETVNRSIMKKELAEERDKVLKGIKDTKNTIIRLNKPGRFAKEDEDELQQITTLLNSVECLDLDDNPIMPLRHSDINALMIKKGSLSDNERMQVQAHVEYTYHILKSLPWPDHLQEIPRIAFFHHERLDGSGYPIGAVSSDISLSGRILGVADIYDALTASDRSYKKKDTSERAMEIIKNEAKDGKLDSEVVRIFQEIISRTE